MSRTFEFMGRRVEVAAESVVDAVVLLAVYGFLLSVFTPDVMLSETITAGGDTASHYYPAEFLRDELLPKGHVMGWLPGWYGGMPLFQFYFTVPFVLMALMSYVMPLQIAFKLVTVLGVFTLPLTAYACMKLMRFKFPVPSAAAAFSLPFLFMESHSMWGGNIPSTLAGEFSYSISLSLTILFLGLMYRGMEDRKYVLHNSVLLAFVALTHVYTVLWAVLSTTYLLLRKNMDDVKSRILYMAKSYPLAFMLTGFWIIPLLARIKYTTAYDIPWRITEDVMPPILWPFVVLAGFGFFTSLYSRDKRVWYLGYSILSGLVFFFLASKLGVVDIRFLPFVYVTLMLAGAYGLQQLIRPLKAKWIVPLIVVLLTVYWVNGSKAVVSVSDDGVKFNTNQVVPQLLEWKYSGFTPHWVRWNYEGFERKSLWPQYKAVNDFMGGGVASPRAKFEHSDQHNAAGTVRAFESIPLFAGRSILEGLYMQSIHTSPFTFYIQSEVSEQQSCPFWAIYPCTSFNLGNGTEHLKLFNTQYLVARSEKAKKALREHPEWRLAYSEDPFEVWELTTNTGQYVTVPENRPVLFETSDWKNISYQWFKRVELLDTPVAFKHSVDSVDREHFTSVYEDAVMGDLETLEGAPVGRECSVREIVEAESIEFTTDCVGEPHIISVSYYPSWRAEGADRVYLVSPSFMLVYPAEERVRLVYSKTAVDWLGILLTVSAAAVILYTVFGRSQKLKRFFSL